MMGSAFFSKEVGSAIGRNREFLYRCAKLSVFPNLGTSDMRCLLLILALLFLSIGCQSPYRPSQIPPPGTGTVGRRDPYYQPNNTQLGATQRRSPAYTARADGDRRLYNSDQQKIEDRNEQPYDDTLLDDTSSTSPSATSIVSDDNWRTPDLSDDDFNDDRLYEASRFTPGFRR